MLFRSGEFVVWGDKIAVKDGLTALVEGEAKGGMVIDFADLKQELGDVLGCYDHRSLNDFLEYPSVENICQLLSEKLKQKLAFPFTLRVWEGQGKWAEI